MCRERLPQSRSASAFCSRSAAIQAPPVGPADRIQLGSSASERPVVQVRRVVEMAGIACGIEFDVEHPARHRAPITASGAGSRPVWRVRGKQSTRGVVPESSSSTSTAPRRSRSRLRLECQVKRRIEQRMTRTDEGRQWLALRRQSATSRRRCARSAAAPARRCRSCGRGCERCRDMRDLVPTRSPLLALCRRASEMPPGRTTRCSAAGAGALRPAPCPRGRARRGWRPCIVGQAPALRAGLCRCSRSNALLDDGRQAVLEPLAARRSGSPRSAVRAAACHRTATSPSTSKTWPPSAVRASSSFSSSVR